MSIRTHDTIPFLMFRALAKVTKIAQDDCKRMDLTLMSGRVMTIMALNKEPTVGELALAASIDQSTLSHMLNKLQKRGLMEKERQSSDNRSVRVVLTAAGREVASNCLIAARRREKLILKEFSPKEVVAFKRMLSQMSDIFDKLPKRRMTSKPLADLLNIG